MKLSLYTCICLCAAQMVNCGAVPVELRLGDEARSASYTDPVSSARRSTRAVHIKFAVGKLAFAMGRRAIQLLLKESKEVPTTAKYRLYEKSGSFEKALEDFRKADPVGQHDFLTTTGVGKVGRVGDRLLVIEKYGSDTGKPTIDIIKIDSASKSGNKTGISGKLTVRIVYKD